MIFNYIAQNWVEIAAVIFAILYLVLAVKQNILCWISGILSSILYFFIMRSAGLYMEAYLQIFYVFMGFYGLVQCCWLLCSLEKVKEKMQNLPMK